MIQAVIFDLDGLLIDSEPLWQAAEVAVFSGIGLPFTAAMARQTTGLRVDEVVKHWHARYAWKAPSQKEIAQRINQNVLQLIQDRGQAKSGAHEAISACRSAGLPIAVASSSSRQLIAAALEKLKIAHNIQFVQSAQDEPFGKPHPAVYLRAAEQLGVEPVNCLALEDSANGVLAAKAAKMKCIAIPEPEDRNDKRFGIADMLLHSLNDFKPEMLKDW